MVGRGLYANTPEDRCPHSTTCHPSHLDFGERLDRDTADVADAWHAGRSGNAPQIAGASRLERNGARGVCGLLFFLAIGWYPISRSTIIASGKDITALSEGLWQNDPTQKEAMEAEFLKRYPLLANVPLEERGNYLRKRIESDCVVAGSTIMITLLIAGFGVALSIACGALIAKVLKDRQLSLWIWVPRCLLSWLALGRGIIAACDPAER